MSLFSAFYPNFVLILNLSLWRDFVELNIHDLERERSQGTVHWTHLCVRAVLDGVTRITLLLRKDPRDPFLPPQRGAGPGSARH